MSRKNTNKINEKDNIAGSLKAENYLSTLQNENNILNAEIRKLNDIVIKLKSQLSNYEKEKKNLISNSTKKENDLKELKKKLIQTKKEVEELKQKMDLNKNDQQKNVEELKTQNDILQQYKNENQILLVQLQNKITDLEFQLKSKESQKNFFVNPLTNDKGISLSISPSTKKMDSNVSYMQEIINDDETYSNIIKQNNNFINNNEFFLTGNNELIEMKEINQKLNNELCELKKEMDLNKNEKSELNIQLQKLQEEYNDLLNLLTKKNLEINNKLNQQSQLSNNLIMQLNKNQQMRKNFENIKIKYSLLAKTKKELEDIIFLQENKVQELATNVKKVSNIIKEKDKEIKDNKSYIVNLEDTIKTLSTEFKKLRNKKNQEAEKKINLLKVQINNLKKEYNNNNEMHGNEKIIINNINNNKYSFIKYRNNANGKGQKPYVTSLTNEKGGHSANTINNSPGKVKIKGRTTPFILKKITKNIKDVPVGNKKLLKKKNSETPFRHVPGSNSVANKSLNIKKNININNKNRFMNNRLYNNSYKELNLKNGMGNLNNIEQKKDNIINDIIMENGMSQSEFNSSTGQLYKNVKTDEKEKDQNINNINNINNKNLLLNSQIEKKDKECVDNLKLFINKLIDDLDN